MQIRNMKILSVFLCVCFLAVSGVSVSNAQQVTAKLGYLDLSEIHDKWEKYNTVSQELKTYVVAKRQNLLQTNKELMDEMESLKLKQDLLPPETVKQRRDQLNTGFQQLRKQELSDAKEVEDTSRKMLAPLEQELKEIVEAIAKEGKYAFIFNRRNIFFADEKYNITGEVVKRLNKK